MKVLQDLKLNLKHYSCDNCWLDAATYSNGRLALQVMARDMDDVFDEPILTATVNLPDIPCTENEIWVKEWGENEEILGNLIAWGVIEPLVLGWVRTGYVEASKYRLTPAFMLKLSDELIKMARGEIK